jgi:phosphoribosylamine-glycine ligase
MELKNKTALVIDLGLQGELASRLARDLKTVYYWVPAYHELYPTPLKSFIGKGLEGVERIPKLFPYVDKVDYIISPEGQFDDTADFLRKHKYPVAGPGEVHTWLETKRWESRTNQAEIGLPTQESEILTGVTALSQYGDTHKDFMVKGNGFRGLFDSFKVKSTKDLTLTINHIKYRLGPFCEDIPFMVEECKEGLETGYDTISWDGKQIWPSLLSLAAKGECYLGKVCTEKEMPPGYRLMHKMLSESLKGYRFFYSTETITGKDQVPYLIDLTMRIGSPSPFSIYLELYENFSEVVCGMASGEQIDPKAKEEDRYVASVNHSLEWEQKENFTEIEFPKEMKRWMKLVKGCRKNATSYACPDWDIGITAIAFGKTPESAIKLAKERSSEVCGKGLGNNSRFLDDYPDEIKEAKQIGIDF